MPDRDADEGVGLLQVGREREKTLDTLELEENAPEKATWRNLPHKRQLLLLALCRLSTPLSNSCILPYIYYLVKSILPEPDQPSANQQISRLTGLLVAAYPLGQMATSMVWGKLSDKYGRRPAILLGLFISVISNIAFGFSRSIGILLFWRVVAGMANGMLGVMRTMTAEIVKDRKHHTRAFLALPVVFNSGRVAAMAIGGCLADPTINLPWLFGPSGLFNFHDRPGGVAWTLEYPYALPALFNGAVLAICLILATLWLKESLPSKANTWDPGLIIGGILTSLLTKQKLESHFGYSPTQVEELQSLTTDEPTSEPGSPSSTPTYGRTVSVVKDRPIWTAPLIKTLVAFGLLPLHNATFLHVFPIFLSMPAAPNDDSTVLRFTGGLGLSSSTVGLYLASFGICGILLQLFIYPRLQIRVGNLGISRIASAIFPLTYLLAPYLALLSRHGTAKWVAMGAVLFFQVIGRTMAIPSSVILLTEAAPHRSVLGTVHGAGNTLSALSSAIGPLIGGMLLAKGIDVGAIGLVWWSWLFLIAFMTFAWNLHLKKGVKAQELRSRS